MTNSYSLSPTKRPNLILIHGSNNNAAAFKPLYDELKNLGWNAHFVTLPCHGENRREAVDFKTAFQVFDKKMEALISEPYVVVAFSHGGLYLQLWLEKHKGNLPLKQVLLAPSLYIHRQKTVEKLLKMLPKFFFVKSLAPAPFRRYQTMTVWEYRILLDGMGIYQRHNKGFKIPTLLMIDPKDELVDAKLLESKVKEGNTSLLEFQFWNRDYLTKGFARHHIFFHPNYFSKEDWQSFLNRIQDFLK